MRTEEVSTGFLEQLFLPYPVELTATDEPSMIQLPDRHAEMYTSTHRGLRLSARRILMKTQFP